MSKKYSDLSEEQKQVIRKRCSEYARRNPHVNKKSKLKYKEANREKVAAYQKNRQLKRRYGITIEQYEAMLVAQNFKCGICDRHRSQLKKDLVVDHCHTTNKVRALLCQECNAGLGMFRENVETLKSVIAYISRHKEESA